MEFNEKLKNIRNKYKLTQSEISELISVPLATYIKWENGSRIPAEYLQNHIIRDFEKLNALSNECYNWVKEMKKSNWFKPIADPVENFLMYSSEKNQADYQELIEIFDIDEESNDRNFVFEYLKEAANAANQN